MSSLEQAAARLIAFYLPQYHPIPENDAWWGKGFTEWTNTAKARPLFAGHYQPHTPADLGFYDLRLPEAREAQAAMAREYGIEAFCYYHYWFAGRRILEKPVEAVLHSGKPDFPFCLCWANQSWTGVWHGAPDRMLIEQTYPGEEDHRHHFDYLLQTFRDPRYLRVDGKPLFVVFAPDNLPDSKVVTDLWRQLAREAGLPGLYLLGVHRSRKWQHDRYGFDGFVHTLLPPLRKPTTQIDFWRNPLMKVLGAYRDWRQMPSVYRYADVIPRLIADAPAPGLTRYPCALPNWDNTPRSGARGLVLHGSTPDLFRQHLGKAIRSVAHRPAQQRLVFIKAWNEWAEGNHLEPDLRYGKGYLEAVRKAL